MKKSLFDDEDEFWSLNDLMPKKNNNNVYIPSKNDTSVVSLEISSDDTKVKEASGEKIPQNYSEWSFSKNVYEKRRLETLKEVIREYEPNYLLLRKVLITSDRTIYKNKEKFLVYAEKYYNLNLDSYEYVEFSSFYPQYTMLNDVRLKCYIGLRTKWRNKIFPETSPSYIYLYLYEILNLTTLIEPKKQIELVLDLINGYPNANLRLQTDMLNWLCDLCLINDIELPKDAFKIDLKYVINCAVNQAFYYSYAYKNLELEDFLKIICNYNYENSVSFKKYGPEVFDYVFKAVKKACSDENLFDDIKFLKTLEITNDAFYGAVLVSNSKRTIMTKSVLTSEFNIEKNLITQLIKYAINKLSNLLNEKIITVDKKIIGNKLIHIVDEYFENCTDLLNTINKLGIHYKNKKNKEEIKPEIPDYEKYYEPQNKGISFDEAINIEKESWDLTDKLVSAFGEKEENVETTEVNKAIPVNIPVNVTIKETKNEHKDIFKEAIKCILNEDKKSLELLAKQKGMLLDSFCDQINEHYFDEIGDQIIEIAGNEYRIIEDYIDDIKNIIGE